jgi:RNA polymerase sigma factor (sigma-70 family)
MYMRQHLPRLTREEETERVEEFQEKEEKARKLVSGIPVADAILTARLDKRKSTRVGFLDRVKSAVLAVEKESASNPDNLELARISRQASGLLHVATAKRGEFCLHYMYIAIAEGRKYSADPIAQEDWAQVGLIGLLDAAIRFDTNRGIRFSSYARWWVRARILRAIKETDNVIVIKSSGQKILNDLETARRKYARLGMAHSLKDLADEIGTTQEYIVHLLNLRKLVSLDSPGIVVEDLLIDLITYDTEEPQDDVVILSCGLETLKGNLAILDEREHFVVTRTFGAYGFPKAPQTTIAKRLGCTTKTVGKILQRALSALSSAQ